jgi:hypothetical protein
MHASLVHGLASSQLTAEPPVHTPFAQVSPCVQALPSLQAPAVGVCVHPLADAQPSAVHTLPSSQLGAAPPTHWPPTHLSAVVQALPSLQLTELFVFTHPRVGWHRSSVHGLLSLHESVVPGLHAPPLHVSAVVQALPSSHGFVFAVVVHPLEGLQPSSVHGLPSLHCRLAPALHTPPPHTSPDVQALPSSHGEVFAT